MSAVLALVVLVGCGGSSSSGAGTTQAGQQTVIVSAAASLTGAFDQLADQFQAANPRVVVKLNYGGSADLAAQILPGARVDICATANTSTMNTVTTAGLVDGPPRVFATNHLPIVVAKGNPKGISSFADLAKPSTTVVVETPQEPAGAATRTVPFGHGFQKVFIYGLATTATGCMARLMVRTRPSWWFADPGGRSWYGRPQRGRPYHCPV